MSSDLLTPEDVAERLGVSTQTLASWRTTNRYDLPFIRIGRLVRYRTADVEDFLDGFDDDEEEDDSENEDPDDDGDDDD